METYTKTKQGARLLKKLILCESKIFAHKWFIYSGRHILQENHAHLLFQPQKSNNHFYRW